MVLSNLILVLNDLHISLDTTDDGKTGIKTGEWVIGRVHVVTSHPKAWIVMTFTSHER